MHGDSALNAILALSAAALFLMGTRATREDNGIWFTLDLRLWAVGSVVLLVAIL